MIAALSRDLVDVIVSSLGSRMHWKDEPGSTSHHSSYTRSVDPGCSTQLQMGGRDVAIEHAAMTLFVSTAVDCPATSSKHIER